ncbi:DUF4097 family beta strand repeat-containing protein [Kitasatospora sp. NPDC056327]|uniref:DUF4097 family beta strand repeat-containing protein n=1 Tax=Kitasatospora sp. NPDC056327 TaxID=3345785 RepID=UPI0035DE9DE5
MTTTAPAGAPAPEEEVPPVPRGRAGWRLIGTLVLVVALLFGAGQTWGMAVHQEVHVERTYPVAVTGLRLDTGRATVRIRPGKEGQVVVRQRLDWIVRKPVVSALFDQHRLDLRMYCNQVLPVSDLGCGAVIELEVPPGIEVSGKQSSGSIDIAGTTGGIDLLSTSGEVVLTEVSGPLAVRTTSGSVRGRQLAVPTVTAGATSGSVQLGFVEPPRSVDIGVTSGAVVLGLPRGSRYDFEGGTAPRGGIDPALADRSSPNKIRVSVSSGSVSVLAKDREADGD